MVHNAVLLIQAQHLRSIMGHSLGRLTPAQSNDFCDLGIMGQDMRQ